MPLLILGGISLIHGSNISELLFIPNVDRLDFSYAMVDQKKKKKQHY